MPTQYSGTATSRENVRLKSAKAKEVLCCEPGKKNNQRKLVHLHALFVAVRPCLAPETKNILTSKSPHHQNTHHEKRGMCDEGVRAQRWDIPSSDYKKPGFNSCGKIITYANGGKMCRENLRVQFAGPRLGIQFCVHIRRRRFNKPSAGSAQYCVSLLLFVVVAGPERKLLSPCSSCRFGNKWFLWFCDFLVGFASDYRDAYTQITIWNCLAKLCFLGSFGFCFGGVSFGVLLSPAF